MILVRFFFVVVLMLLGSSCQKPIPAPSESEAGRCAHRLPKALCTTCNPKLAAVFKSKGDWCAAHGFPESFCPICNPNAPIPGIGNPPPAAADWCAGHGLPESKCTRCNPSLVGRFKTAGDWCEAHGFPESVCPICNPQKPPGDGKLLAVDWCVEHALPESKCTKCNPSLIEGFKKAGDWCEAHSFPESACPVCSPGEPPEGAEEAAIEARVVRFKAPEVEDAVGIETAKAQRAEITADIECAARIMFDSDRIADVRAIVPGIIRRVRVELGTKVSQGTPLFSLESTRVGEIQGALQIAQEQVRTAKANLVRQKELRQKDIASARQVELAEQKLADAQAKVRTAQTTLRLAGAARSEPSGRYTLSAPIEGTVVRRPAVLGLLATERDSLATIADTSIMWALCDVAEGEAAQLAQGQTMMISVGSEPAQTFQGPITWIAAEVDPKTRTVTARAQLKNPHGQLRAHQFARARIQVNAVKDSVSVPRSAVQRVRKKEVVFVRTARGVYEPRIVQRHGIGQMVQVKGKIQPGDAVVTTGAVLLRTEIMPGSIGAGCCEVEPPGGD